MQVDTLRWFQQVADGATVTEVGERHLVSQPAVSRALTRLERDVGTPLLVKQGRGLALTDAGSAFKRHVDVAVHALDDALAAVAQLADPDTGTVRLAFQLSLGRWLVPALVTSFLAEHPRVAIELYQSRDGLPGGLVGERLVDLELTAQRPTDDGVVFAVLASEPLLLAVPDGHALAGETSVFVQEAADEDFVMLRRGSALRDLTDDLFTAAGREPKVAVEVDDLATLQALVEAEVGLGVIPAMGRTPTSQAGDGVVLIELADADAFRRIGLISPLHRPLLPSAELFRQHIHLAV